MLGFCGQSGREVRLESITTRYRPRQGAGPRSGFTQNLLKAKIGKFLPLLVIAAFFHIRDHLARYCESAPCIRRETAYSRSK